MIPHHLHVGKCLKLEFDIIFKIRNLSTLDFNIMKLLKLSIMDAAPNI